MTADLTAVLLVLQMQQEYRVQQAIAMQLVEMETPSTAIIQIKTTILPAIPAQAAQLSIVMEQPAPAAQMVVPYRGNRAPGALETHRSVRIIAAPIVQAETRTVLQHVRQLQLVQTEVQIVMEIHKAIQLLQKETIPALEVQR